MMHKAVARPGGSSGIMGWRLLFSAPLCFFALLHCACATALHAERY